MTLPFSLSRSLVHLLRRRTKERIESTAVVFGTLVGTRREDPAFGPYRVSSSDCMSMANVHECVPCVTQASCRCHSHRM